jgi:hypothetical protein
MGQEDLSSIYKSPEQNASSPLVLNVSAIRDEFIADSSGLPPVDTAQPFAREGRDLAGLTHIIAGKAAEHGIQGGFEAVFQNKILGLFGRFGHPRLRLEYDLNEPEKVDVYRGGAHYLLQGGRLDEVLEQLPGQPHRIVAVNPEVQQRVYSGIADVLRPNGSVPSINVFPLQRPQAKTA